jgi:hypothetical protein
MDNLSGSEKGALRGGLLITVMAALIAGIASENFFTGFVLTAVVCGVALLAATLLARVVISRRNR